MSRAAIEYIWKAIQESERSDKFQVMSDEMPITTLTHESPEPPDLSGVPASKPIAEVALSPQPMNSDPSKTIPVPPMLQP